MAMNKFMHPRNPYKKRPDFKQLAIDFPDFRKHAKQDLSGKIQFNFKDQGAVWALTKCLLKRDFDLDVEILPNRLVPTLPLRMNYLLWIEDLLSIYKPRNVYGIDIGTGASCIYPLLGARHFSWNMMGTEIDIDSVKCALSNIENNFLSDKIKVKCVTEDVVLNDTLEEETIYDFCVCNPPFFSDSEELMMENKSRNKSRHAPRNAPTGIPNELLTPGGELVFVARIISDSQILKDQVRIYSVMIGKKSNLKHLKELVRENEEVTSVATTVFCQGRTTRWGLAWTYVPGLELNQVPHASTKKKALSFAPFIYLLPVTLEQNLQTLKEKILSILSDFKIETDYEESSGMLMITLKAFENTWVNSRKRRRQQKLLQEQQDEGTSKQQSDERNAKINGQGTEETSEAADNSDASPVKKARLDPNFETGPSVESNPVETVSTEPSGNSLELMTENPEPIKDLGSSIIVTESNQGQSKEAPGSKPKTEADNQAEYLVASLIMKENEDATEIIIEMYYIEGTGGKDSANQLLTCIKNRLKHELLL